ncbi:hypothetical protein M3Y98_00804600 [Aphelenchoides besseyi]|nr:hypothetical protein M3Y98_00804600 [Aphelenchoides besseyi]KAI6212073.1 hypothetical protein M3Y96_00501600 [Aphelenchoides besseyi]
MVFASPTLWQYSLVTFVLAILSLIPLCYSIFVITDGRRMKPQLLFHLFYGIATWIFSVTAFAIVFKKAISGSFGYSNSNTLKLKYRAYGFLAIIFLLLDLFGMLYVTHSILYVCLTSINTWTCLILCRIAFLQIRATTDYIKAAIMVNSHENVQISIEDAGLLYRMDCEKAIVDYAMYVDGRSRVVDAMTNVHYYFFLKLQNKLRALMLAPDSQKQWRVSDLLNDIQTQLSALNVDDSKATLWQRLADRPQIHFPCSRDSETGLVYYENKTDILEDVD